MPAEQMKDKVETKTAVDASSAVGSDNSEHEDADADLNGTSKEDEDGTEEVDMSDEISMRMMRKIIRQVIGLARFQQSK
jgi:hypothetical protein